MTEPGQDGHGHASHTAAGTGASSYLNFNGGTLKAVSAQAAFLPALTGVYVNGAFGSFSGGAVIDSNLVDITIGAALIALGRWDALHWAALAAMLVAMAGSALATRLARMHALAA
mgnify:CR=1 FL=1